MNRQKLVLKSILFLLLVALVYIKFKNPNPSWVFEISTDLGIVAIFLGLGEILLRLLYLSLSNLYSSFQKLTSKIMNHGIKQLAVAVLLLAAGLLSPSNGIDDKVDRTPLHILTVTILIMAAAVGIFLIAKKFEAMQEANDKQSE